MDRFTGHNRYRWLRHFKIYSLFYKFFFKNSWPLQPIPITYRKFDMLCTVTQLSLPVPILLFYLLKLWCWDFLARKTMFEIEFHKLPFQIKNLISQIGHWWRFIWKRWSQPSWTIKVCPSSLQSRPMTAHLNWWWDHGEGKISNILMKTNYAVCCLDDVRIANVGSLATPKGFRHVKMRKNNKCLFSMISHICSILTESKTFQTPGPVGHWRVCPANR